MDINEKTLRDRLSYLETINDQLYTELAYVDKLMRNIGFTDGLSTVKETAQTLSEEITSEE